MKAHNIVIGGRKTTVMKKGRSKTEQQEDKIEE